MSSKDYEPVSSKGWMGIAAVAVSLLAVVVVGGVLTYGGISLWVSLGFFTLWVAVVVFILREKNRGIGQDREHQALSADTPDTQAARQLHRPRA